MLGAGLLGAGLGGLGFLAGVLSVDFDFGAGTLVSGLLLGAGVFGLVLDAGLGGLGFLAGAFALLLEG